MKHARLVCLLALLLGCPVAADELLLDSGPLAGYRLLALEGESAILEDASGVQSAVARGAVLGWQREPDQPPPAPGQDLAAIAGQLQQNADGIHQLQEAARLQYQAIIETRPVAVIDHVGLEVVIWQGIHDRDDYRVTGLVRNVSARPLPGVQVMVQLLDRQGVVRWQLGDVGPATLAPGMSGRFTVVFRPAPTAFSGCRVIPQLAGQALRQQE